MADSEDIHFFFYKGGLQPTCRTLPVSPDASILDFMTKLELFYGQPRCNSVLWKPRQAVLPNDNGRREIEQRLKKYGNKLTSFCDIVHDYALPVSSLFHPLSQKAKQTALVLGIEGSQHSTRRVQLRSGDEDEDEVLTTLVDRFIKAVKVTDRLSPSLSASPSHYSSHQQSKVPILDGRYGVQAEGPQSVAAPVELFHSAFATFLGYAKDQTLSVPEDIVKRTAEFMHSQSKIATPESLRTETRNYLSKLLAAAVTQSTNMNRTNSGHIIGLAMTSGPYQQAALAIIEEKGELGHCGDPSVQGSFSYIEHWTASDRRELSKACACPSFIISLVGPWLVVCAAIFTTLPIVHRLTDYIWLGYSRSLDDAIVLRIARIFYALRLGVKDLKTYYEELEYNPEDTTSRFFPLATSCVLPDGKKLDFNGADPSCVTFLVADREDAGRKFVVKFVERYGDEAHKLLAEHGLALKLLYYGDVWPTFEAATGCGPRRMVVMDYVRGRCAGMLDDIPQGIRDAVRRALDLLHENGMVHGDVRAPNIMIEDAEDADKAPKDSVGSQTRIIDFDWAGNEGWVRYPHYLSKTGRVEGVEDYALITAKHDDAMAELLQ